MSRRKSNWQWHITRYYLPSIQAARNAGLRTADDIWEYIQMYDAERIIKIKSRSSLYRTLLELRSMGLDPGPDNRSTARKHGRKIVRRKKPRDM